MKVITELNEIEIKDTINRIKIQIFEKTKCISHQLARLTEEKKEKIQINTI